MSAVTQNEYTGNGSTTNYSFTFPYLKTSDIKASLDAVDTTAFTLANATTLQFNTAPANGVKIKIFRETGVDNLTATFYAGSAIKSEDLNDNFTQNLFVTQEVNQRYLSTLGGTMTGDLGLGEDAKIVFEGATDDANETTLTVADPTADRTITLPNVTGTVVTTGDTGTVTSTMLADGTIVTADLADDAVRTAKILDGNITNAKLAADSVTGAKIADDQINSEHYVDGSIDTAHIANSQITNALMADNSVNTNELVDDAVTAAKLASNSVVSASIVDGSIVEADIANNAITNAKLADDSVGAAELVDTSVGTAALASNAVTLAKMADNSVGTSELVDDAVTTAKISAGAVGTTELDTGAITTAKLATDAVTNAKIGAGAVGTTELDTGAITTAKIATDAVTNAKIGAGAVGTTELDTNAVTTAKIADAELKTLAGMQSGTASKLADSTALTADIADLNQIDGLTKQTTISNSDSSFPTSGAVVDYVAAQIAPLGGLEVIATEVAFPNTQPASGVVISISDAGGVVFNGSGTSTTGRTVGGSTVTISNAPSSLNNETLVAGVGLMVSSTGLGQVYHYHKILGKEDDIKQLSDDINDFNARYRVGSSNPTSALDSGDLFFNTGTGKLLVYNGTNSAWEEAQSIGNFFISTFSEAFDGSRTQFTLSNAPTNVQQIILSLNGVIQKPGTAFTLSGSTVTLASAPASGTEYFAVVMGSTVNIGTPSDNTVDTDILMSGAVTDAKVSASAAIAGTKISPDFGSQDITTAGNITTTGGFLGIDGTLPQLRLNDTNSENDYEIQNADGVFKIRDIDASADRLAILSNGNVGIGTTSPSNLLHLKSNAPYITFEDDDNNQDWQIQATAWFAIRDQTASAERMRITSAGNVGIGTTSPAEELVVRADAPSIQLESSNASGRNYGFQANNDGKFHVYDGTAGANRFTLDSSGKVGIGTNSPLKLLDVKGAGGATVEQYLRNNTINLLSKISGTSNAQFGTETSHPLLFLTGNSERIRVDEHGRFFIGTTTTSLGSSGVFGELCLRGGTEGAGIHLADNDANVHAGFFTSDNSNFFVIRTITNHPMIFRTNNTERMRIASDGKIAVGRTSQITVASNTSDSVFEQLTNSSWPLALHSGQSNKRGLSVFYADTGAGNAGDQYILCQNQTSTKFQVTSNGNVFTTGGIYLNGDTAAANALDDYEEGSWQPQIGGNNMNVNHAHYTKIGNFVHLDFDIIANASANGNTITGLPFSAVEYSAFHFGWVSNTSQGSQNTTALQGGLLSSAGFTMRTAGGNVNMDVANGQRVIGTAQYRTAS